MGSSAFVTIVSAEEKRKRKSAGDGEKDEVENKGRRNVMVWKRTWRRTRDDLF